MDFTSGRMSCLIGHGHLGIAKVITEHAESLDHVFSSTVTPPVMSLAKRLTSLRPPGLDNAFFLSTGGEIREAAIRLAKCDTGKWEIVGPAFSWHGMTCATLGAQYHNGRAGCGPIMPSDFALLTSNP
jgi:4-aminobutyrate aminotransferase-like enzyme